MQRTNRFIRHYDSQYYDPAKAHEYYLRNRQLKGRQTSGMSDQQKEAWAYSKDQISTEKKSKVENQLTDRDQKIELFRSLAEETRKKISERLKMLSKQISEKSEAEREKIEAKRQAELEKVEEERTADIENLPPIPKNLPPELKAKMMEDRKKEIADINEEAQNKKGEISNSAKNEKGDVTNDSKKNREDARDEASVDRENARTILKSTIDVARKAFEKAKADLDANYEKTYQDEYDKVLSNVQGKVKKKRGKK